MASLLLYFTGLALIAVNILVYKKSQKWSFKLSFISIQVSLLAFILLLLGLQRDEQIGLISKVLDP